MYPSPATLYQSPPSMAPRPSYPNPNQNSPYASNSMPPPPPPPPGPVAPQYPSNSVSGHPGQPPMPYATSAIPQQQQTNNLNHATYVRTSWIDFYQCIVFLLCRIMIWSICSKKNDWWVRLLKSHRFHHSLVKKINRWTVVLSKWPIQSWLKTFRFHFSHCHSRVMRCSLNVIPQTKDLLNKSRLPLGILIHPFKDLEVRCFWSHQEFKKILLIFMFCLHSRASVLFKEQKLFDAMVVKVTSIHLWLS